MSDLLRCLNEAMFWKQFLLFKINKPTTCSAAISPCSPRLVAPLKLSRVEPGQIPITDPGQSWPPNNPHPLDWLYDSLSSPPVAGVWLSNLVTSSNLITVSVENSNLDPDRLMNWNHGSWNPTVLLWSVWTASSLISSAMTSDLC